MSIGPHRNYKPAPRVLVRSKKLAVFFGVAWDQDTPEILNAITVDVLAYSKVVPTTCRLVVVCQDFGFLDRLRSITGLEITSDPKLVKECEIWKLYYMETCPPMPENGSHVYSKKVGVTETAHIELTQGREGYPSLFNPADNQVVPVGRSPNINKIPPRYYSGWNPLPAN